MKTEVKSEELRIGNLVYDETGTTTVVESIIPEHNRKRYAIPLTEDKLIELGMERARDGRHYFLNHHGFCLVFDGDDWCLKSRINEPYVILYCRYVHQFQNTYYALTQTELTK